MKKIYFLMVFFAICFCVLMSSVNNNGVNADAKCEVSFHFDGLQAIAFGDSKRVSDGILDVHHHNPLIEVKEIKGGKETVIRTIKADELKGKVLNVDVPNNQQHPTRYYSPDMSKDSQDFRWCLDIENDLFQKQLYLREDKLFCKINFMEGEFFATQLTKDKYQFVSPTKIHSFNRQIGRPAAQINLKPTDNLVISGLSQQINLPYQTGISYKVTITNLPPADMADMNHFVFYYDLVKEPVTKYMPTTVKKASFLPHPPPLLCEAIIFSKSSLK
ncbi:MAG: hypothetical protein WAQ98_30230 [Blastocatellia bacterium]